MQSQGHDRLQTWKSPGSLHKRRISGLASWLLCLRLMAFSLPGALLLGSSAQFGWTGKVLAHCVGLESDSLGER